MGLVVLVGCVGLVKLASCVGLVMLMGCVGLVVLAGCVGLVTLVVWVGLVVLMGCVGLVVLAEWLSLVGVEGVWPGLGTEEEWRYLDAEVCVCLAGVDVCVCLVVDVCVCLVVEVCVCLGVCGPAVGLRAALAAPMEVCDGALGHSELWCALGRPSEEEPRGGVELLFPAGGLGGLSESSSIRSIFICVTLGDSGLQSVFGALVFSCLMCCFSSLRASSSPGCWWYCFKRTCQARLHTADTLLNW